MERIAEEVFADVAAPEGAVGVEDDALAAVLADDWSRSAWPPGEEAWAHFYAATVAVMRLTTAPAGVDLAACSDAVPCRTCPPIDGVYAVDLGRWRGGAMSDGGACPAAGPRVPTWTLRAEGHPGDHHRRRREHRRHALRHLRSGAVRVGRGHAERTTCTRSPSPRGPATTQASSCRAPSPRGRCRRTGAPCEVDEAFTAQRTSR